MAERGDKAREDAAGVAELKTQLAAAAKEYERFKDAAADAQFGAGFSAAAHQVDELTAKLAKLREEKRRVAAEGVSSAIGGGNKGPDLGDLKSGAGVALDAGGALTAGGAALSAGGGIVLGAAERLAIAGAGFMKQGLEFGIQMSAERAKQKAIFDQLTHGQGEVALQVRAKIAGETGMSGVDVGMRMRGLILAGFKRNDTELLLRAAADLGEVKGLGKAEAFLSTLDRLSHRGSTTARDLKAMTGAGVDLADIFGRLGQKGETLQGFEARLKVGKVAALDFARAAGESVEAKMGGIAGKGLEAGINRAKVGLRGLFSGFDTGPLEKFGEVLVATLSGKDGAELKRSISDAGNEVIGLIKGVSKEDIKHVFQDAAFAAKELASIVKGAAESTGKIGKALGFGKTDKSVERGAVDNQGVQELVHEKRTVIPFLWYEETWKPKAEADAENAAADAANTGKAIADGMAKGIDNNAGGVRTAAARAAKGGVDAGNEAIGAHSPSVEAGKTGMYYDQGLERGIDQHAGLPAAAAGRAASRMLGAGRGGAPVGSGVSGTSGGGGDTIVSVVYSVVNHLAAGSTRDTEDAAERGARAPMQDFLAKVRSVVKDRNEGLR